MTAISADSRDLAFDSFASNLIPDDTNTADDVFVHERGPSVESTTKEALAGDTVSTNTTTTPDDPVGTSVTTPLAGTVAINEGGTTTAAPAGY